MACEYAYKRAVDGIYVEDKQTKAQVKHNIRPTVNSIVYCYCNNIISTNYGLQYELIDFSGRRMIVTKKELETQMLALNVDVVNLVIDEYYNIIRTEVIPASSFEEVSAKYREYIKTLGNAYFTIGNSDIGFFKFQYCSLIDYIGNRVEIILPEVYDIAESFASFNKSLRTILVRNPVKVFNVALGVESNIDTIDIRMNYKEFCRTSFKINFSYYSEYSFKNITEYVVPLLDREETLNITLNGKPIKYNHITELKVRSKSITQRDELIKYFDESEIPDADTKLKNFIYKSELVNVDLSKFEIEKRHDKDVLTGVHPGRLSDKDKEELVIPPVKKIQWMYSRATEATSEDAYEHYITDIKPTIERQKINQITLPSTLDTQVLNINTLIYFEVTVSPKKRKNSYVGKKYKIDCKIPLFNRIKLPDNCAPVLFDSYCDEVELAHNGKIAKIKDFEFTDFGGIPIKIISIRNIPTESSTNDVFALDRLYGYNRAITIETSASDRRTVSANALLAQILLKNIYPVNARVYYNGNIVKV